MSTLDLSRDTLLRIVISAVAAELRDGCGRQLDLLETASWTGETEFGETGLDMDSLELLACAGRINQLFHMHETGIEDYLLRDRRFGDWAKIVRASLESAGERLTFLTSGSTGDPKPCTHDVRTLTQEIESFAALFTGTRRIIACAPSHHIYGFLFTALLPSHLDVPVIEGRFLSPGQWAATLQRGDLIVSTPSFWRYLNRSIPTYPSGVDGVTSTAPMARTLADDLKRQGLGRLIEIYGSSETAGIGWRTDPGEPYTLLRHWNHLDDGRLERQGPDGTAGESVEAMDLLIWEPPSATERQGPRRFRPAGRRDNAVQIGGTNVFPARIATVIAGHDLVERCTVRLVQDGSVERLKAHIVLRDTMETTPKIVREIEAWCRDQLKTNERPRILCFADSLPASDTTADDRLEDTLPLRRAAS